MTLGTLGPEGTFSHQVAEKFPGHKILFAMSIDDLFELYNQKIMDKIIVPIENSLSGTIIETLDHLLDCRGVILKEEILIIEHHLVSFIDQEGIKKVYAHPHAYKQCKDFLNLNFLDLEVVYTLSNADSAQKLKEDKEHSAAIVSEYAANLYRVPILSKSIQDVKNNRTRFLLIGEDKSVPTGNDKTSIMIEPKENRCGLLVKLLSPFSKNKINLMKIESRPSGLKLGHYRFFIDFEGHSEEDHVTKALEKLPKYKVLGSYPIEDE